MTTIANQTVAYPTDPLTAIETDAIAEVIVNQSELSPLFHPKDPRDTALFLQTLLKEPRKAHVVEFELDPQNTKLDRKGIAIVYNNVNNYTWEVTLSMREPGDLISPIAKIDSIVRLREKMYPNNNYDNPPVDDPFGGTQLYHYFTREELIDLVLADKKLMCLLAKYNVTREMLDPKNSDQPWYIYPYAYYTFESFRQITGVDIYAPDIVPSDYINHRFMPTGFFNQNIIPKDIITATANWGFVEGIFIIIDCNAKKIVKIVEDPSKRPKSKREPPIPLPVSDPYPPVYHPPMKPLLTSMPEGVSFVVDDLNDIHKVTWDNWEFHWSYQRAGLNLYNIYYTETTADSSDKRKILYKLGASDTVVVYNSTEPLIERNYVSPDSHNWPILQKVVPLVPGRDVPGYAKMYPIVTMDPTGKSRVIPNAVAIYEQETDLAWRVNQGVIDFTGWPNGQYNQDPNSFLQLTGARNRQLVVRMIFSGYYYLFTYSYVFSQSGVIECFCDLMGQTTNQWIAYSPEGEVENGDVRGGKIAKQMLGLNHTHSVVWRMDFDIDYYNPNGSGNVVEEVNTYRVESKKVNPAGQVIKYVEKILKKETARDQNMETNRTWAVYNPHSLNRLGRPRGYEIWSLGLNGNSVSLARDDSQAHLHYGFLKHHFFATRYHDDEQFAAGDFPVLANKQVGIDAYLADKEKIEDKDVVVWFNRMFAHTPVTENYPFINIHRLGISLEPENFFGMNPSCSLEQKYNLLPDGDIGAPALFTYDEVAQ